MKINDGNGMYDAAGLLDTIIVQANDCVKNIAGGQWIAFCNGMVQIARQARALKEGVEKDEKERERQIAELREENNRLTEQLTGLPVCRDSVTETFVEEPALKEEDL